MAIVTSRDVTLAQVANLAYSDTPSTPPAGLSLVSAQALNIGLQPGESFANGVFHNQNAAALVLSGTFDNRPALVLAFRGSDDRQDSLNDLQNINADFPKFADLVAAVDAYAARAGFQEIVVTGHSLGGAMAQLYMGSHPDTGGILHVSDTFGSPGALQTAAPDARITDFVIADDPAVFAGLHRGEIGDVVRSNPLIADALAPAIANDFPGLTAQDVRNSVPSFTANYVNRGETVLLPGASGSTTPLDRNADLAKALIGADPAEHHSDLYVAKVAAAASVDAGAPGTVLTPFTPGRAPEPLFSSSFYLANNKDVAASGIDPQQHYDQYGWHEGRNPDAVFNTRYYLAHNPDVAAAGINPLQHYETNGWHEGRNPDPIFDVTYYLSHNPDVAAAGIDPLLHYEQYGWKEGRDPSASFSTSSYLAHNPDVAAAGVNPLEHYLNTGIEEHRLL